MSCWTWAELNLRVSRTWRETGRRLSMEAVESATRSRLALDGAYLEEARQRYGSK